MVDDARLGELPADVLDAVFEMLTPGTRSARDRFAAMDAASNHLEDHLLQVLRALR
ncbi:MAG TPA: hypothetical protein VF230_14060 [Acidimicrobiales bacterium]